MLGLAALVTALSACGSAEDPTSLLEISPASPEVPPGGAVQFTAATPTAPGEPIAWAVVEANGGTIDTAGVYTAPGTEGTYTVTASLTSLSTAESTQVRVKRNVRVDVSPSTATLAAGESLALSASVTSAVKTVTWSVAEGAAGGTVTYAGVYTAPGTPGVYHLVAASTADPTKTDSAEITVTAISPPPPPAPVTVGISPQTASVVAANTVQFTAIISGSMNAGVTWSVAESGGGTVSATGLYTAPLTAGTYHVVATSAADPSKSATVTVTVTATTPTPVPTPTGSAYYVAHNGSDSNPGTIAAPWRTLSYAMNQLRPGATLYIRGSTSPDTNTPCSGDGAQNGACWTETEACRGTMCSPLYWTSGSSHFAGTEGNPITIATYPGETVIIEPSQGTSVVQMEPGSGGGTASGQTGNAHCSWVVLDGLILDGRNQTNQVVWILPASSTITDPVSSMCSNGAIKNSKIRHGRSTGGIQAYTFRWDFLNNEIYETGSNGTDADRDHAIYTQGQYNRIMGGRIHHNLQGIQTEAVGRIEPGYLTIDGVEIDHNGYNPWSGVSRNGSTGHVLLLENQGKNATVTNCWIHDNTQNGINVGATWSGTLVTGVTVANTFLWNNADASNVGGCGPSIWVRSGSAPVCSNNVSTPQ